MADQREVRERDHGKQRARDARRPGHAVHGVAGLVLRHAASDGYDLAGVTITDISLADTMGWATPIRIERGVAAVRDVVEACARRGVKYVTLFAFSSENWRRPEEEVSVLMKLFVTALDREVAKMHANNIRLKVVGDLSRFDAKLQQMIASAERRKPFLKQLLEDVARTKGSELVDYLPNQGLVPVGNEDIRALIREAIRDTAQQGNVVIVAHAASYALGGRDDVLRVLITGSPFKRASRWLKTSGGRSPEEAAETIRDSDKARASYLKRFYDVDAELAEHYDITVSTDVLTTAQATDLIVRAARALNS